MRPQNIKNLHFLRKSPRRGDSLDRFRKFLGAFIRLAILHQCFKFHVIRIQVQSQLLRQQACAALMHSVTRQNVTTTNNRKSKRSPEYCKIDRRIVHGSRINPHNPVVSPVMYHSQLTMIQTTQQWLSHAVMLAVFETNRRYGLIGVARIKKWG